MYIDKLIKRELTTLIISLILIMTIFISVSYASFIVEDEGQSNTISVGDIDITFCNSTECNENYSNFGQIIGTEDIDGVATPTAIYPYETDAVALESTPYIFNVENTGSLKVFLNAYLEEDLDFVPTGSYENYTSVTTLYSNYVKVGIGECAEGIPDTSNVTITTFGSLTDGNILENISMNVGEDKTYCLWTWLANDTPNAVQSTYFVANINFTAEYQPALPTLTNMILNDNTAYADNVNSPYVNNATPGINFGEVSSDTNGKGLYYTADATKTENGERVYYFRGAVENNYVLFSGFCWRIVRTVEDGSVRLVYGGTPTDGVCPQTGTEAKITYVTYNSTYKDNAYVGYMMGIDNQCAGNSYCEGTTHTTSKLEAQTNTYSSNIKKVIDAWYTGGTTSNGECTNDAITFSNCDFTTLGTNKLSNNSSLIADTPYCNDRSITGTTNNLGFGENTTYYATYTRLYDNKTPTYKCAQNNDKFTMSETKGNGTLANPIGMLTADEVAYAGGVYNTTNNTYYLRTNQYYLTLSASDFYGGFARVFLVGPDGFLNNYGRNVNGVRPAVSLNSEATVSDGAGLYNDPYVIDVN